MKKIFIFLLVACFATTLFAQTIVSTEPSKKNVILEEYTGTNCQYCPDGHKVANQIMTNNPGRAWAINIHQGGFSGNSPDYKTDWGNALANQYGINSYPAATVNRGATWSSNRSQWTSWANSFLAENSPVNVAAQGTINWETRHLTLLVEVYYTGNAANPTNKLNVALLQNNILGPQSGMGLFPEMIVNSQYRHMHMLRDLLTGQWGQDITTTTTGSFWTTTIEYDIPAHVRNIPIELDDLEILVYVAENQKTILSGAKAELSYLNLPNLNPRFTELVGVPAYTCSDETYASVKIKNAGENPITSVELSYTIAGGTPNTITWNQRSIPSISMDTILLPCIVQIGLNQVVKVDMIKVNNVDVTPVSKTTTVKKEVAMGDYSMQLLIRTDQYPGETSYKIFNPNGTVLKQGTTPTANFEHVIDFIPIMSGCHRVEVYDSYGDGAGYVKILNSAGTQIFYNNGQYATKLTAMVTVDLSKYTITASAGEHGTISPVGEIEYNAGSNAVYTFSPDEGFVVEEVYINGEPMNMPLATDYTFVAVEQNYTIHVTFKGVASYTITASAGENGAISPAGEIEYQEGSSAEFVFIPEPYYEVEEVYIDDAPMGMAHATSYTFPAVDKDYKIHVTFKWVEGIKDINGVVISIAPNPVQDKLFITGTYDKLELFSITGQTLATVYNQPTIDVNNLAKGIYFVQILSNGQVCTFKIVK